MPAGMQSVEIGVSVHTQDVRLAIDDELLLAVLQRGLDSPPEVSPQLRLLIAALSPGAIRTFRPRATATVCATWEDIMRFIVASFLVLSSFDAVNAEPLTPMPTQKIACNSSQVSALQVCRDRCDDAVHQCISQCIGQSNPSCTRQCNPTHSTCVQSCFKSSGC
jgi:hypothetical protein